MKEIRKQLAGSLLSVLVFLPILLIAYEKGGTIEFDKMLPASPAASPVAPGTPDAPGTPGASPAASPVPAAPATLDRPAGSGSSQPVTPAEPPTGPGTVPPTAAPPGETLPGGQPLASPSPAPAAASPEAPEAPAGNMVEFSGKVFDVDAKTPVGQAEVVVPELEVETFTNHKGEYHLKPLPVRAKPYELMIQRPGYTNTYESLDASKPGKSTRDFNIRRKGFDEN